MQCNFCQKRFTTNQFGKLKIPAKHLRGDCIRTELELKYCRKCGLPKKAMYNSARNLTRFETSDCGNTFANKSNFNFDRKLTYCNADTCLEVERIDYAELHRLAEMDLGKNYSLRAYRKWRKGLI